MPSEVKNKLFLQKVFLFLLVWTNIIDNAIDAIGERHGNILLRTKRENNNIVVKISDDGPGIPQNNQSRIFEQFFTTKGR
ncbi:MAG: ATP-binding protein [Candidatus Nitrosopolaris sp.]